jgi:hypothetical protein
MKATYFSPGAVPKTYDCETGETPGTVDLLNAKGRVIVSGLPVKPFAEASVTRACAVMVVDAQKSGKKKEFKVPSSTLQVADAVTGDEGGAEL